MDKLLKLEKYQLLHNSIYWCGMIGIFILGFFTADTYVTEVMGSTEEIASSLADIFNGMVYDSTFLLIIMSAILALILGQEFSKRTINLEVSAGHSRKQIFTSKIISYLIAFNLMALVYPVSGCIREFGRFGVADVGMFFYNIIKAIIYSCLLNSAIFLIAILICCYLQDAVKATSVTAIIIFGLSLYLGYGMMLRLPVGFLPTYQIRIVVSMKTFFQPIAILVGCIWSGILNQYNIRQRQAVAGVLRNEEYLKESVANISHDLRTPLTVILGHLQLLQKENLESSQAQRVKVIFSKAEKMKELVETFYDLSILEEQQTVPEKEKFNISNMLINLITENAVALEKENILPEINLPDYSIYVYSDKNMVERILQNLLTNAIKYSVGTIKITLMEKENNNVIFTIENPMSDSSEIDCNRLFDRFYTGDKSRHNGSTGLGLAVVKTLVAILGGNIVAKVHANSLIITLEL